MCGKGNAQEERRKEKKKRSLLVAKFLEGLTQVLDGRANVFKLERTLGVAGVFGGAVDGVRVHTETVVRESRCRDVGRSRGRCCAVLGRRGLL